MCLPTKGSVTIARLGFPAFYIESKEYQYCRGLITCPNGWILYYVIQAAIDMPCYKALSALIPSILAIQGIFPNKSKTMNEPGCAL
jgi:hypothetical protein